MIEFEKERDRVLTRLSHLHRDQLCDAADMVHAASQELRDLTITAGDTGPREVPKTEIRAASAQLQVMCVDLLATSDTACIAAGLEALTQLRRDLP